MLSYKITLPKEPLGPSGRAWTEAEQTYEQIKDDPARDHWRGAHIAAIREIVGSNTENITITGERELHIRATTLIGHEVRGRLLKKIREACTVQVL